MLGLNSNEMELNSRNLHFLCNKRFIMQVYFITTFPKLLDGHKYIRPIIFRKKSDPKTIERYWWAKKKTFFYPVEITYAHSIFKLFSLSVRIFPEIFVAGQCGLEFRALQKINRPFKRFFFNYIFLSSRPEWGSVHHSEICFLLFLSFFSLPLWMSLLFVWPYSYSLKSFFKTA